MTIEQKKKEIRSSAPWFVAGPPAFVFGVLVMALAYATRQAPQFGDLRVWAFVAAGAIAAQCVWAVCRADVCRTINDWHNEEEVLRDSLGHAATDYILGYLATPFSLSSDPVKIDINKLPGLHHVWEMQALRWLAKQVQIAAQEQRLAHENDSIHSGVLIEEADAKYARVSGKFYSTRDQLIARGSDYAAAKQSWKDALW